MAENAFAFWLEKERDVRGEKLPRQKDHRSLSKSSTFPNRDHSLNHRPIVEQQTTVVIDPSELFQIRTPTRAGRPHSVATSATLPTRSSPPVMETEEEVPAKQMAPHSAPPTLEPTPRKPSWWSKQPRRHQSVSETTKSFVSYLDGPIRSVSQSTRIRSQVNN